DDPESRVFTGCNVENASYGATVCAERNAIFAAVAAGFRRISLLAVSTVSTLDGPIEERSPCGVCRQVIREFADASTLVILDRGAEDTLGDLVDIDRLLPWGFKLEV
ncbi:MAG: cytidine deaminase, partial [Verrucomicrobiae bacterium]|nr:cytidine deaminase [Verrucomicrobiae bacterium]